jgi:hypothetical protein
MRARTRPLTAPATASDGGLQPPVEAVPNSLRVGVTGILGLEVDADVILGLICKDPLLDNCRIDTDFVGIRRFGSTNDKQDGLLLLERIHRVHESLVHFTPRLLHVVDLYKEGGSETDKARARMLLALVDDKTHAAFAGTKLAERVAEAFRCHEPGDIAGTLLYLTSCGGPLKAFVDSFERGGKQPCSSSELLSIPGAIIRIFDKYDLLSSEGIRHGRASFQNIRVAQTDDRSALYLNMKHFAAPQHAATQSYRNCLWDIQRNMMILYCEKHVPTEMQAFHLCAYMLYDIAQEDGVGDEFPEHRMEIVANIYNDLEVQECQSDDIKDQDRVQQANKWRVHYREMLDMHDEMGLGEQHSLARIWTDVCDRLKRILSRTRELCWEKWRASVRDLARASDGSDECNSPNHGMYYRIFEKFASDLYGVNMSTEDGILAVLKQCDLYAIARAGLTLLQAARPPMQDRFGFEDFCRELLHSPASPSFRRVDLRLLRKKMVRFKVVAI